MVYPQNMIKKTDHKAFSDVDIAGGKYELLQIYQQYRPLVLNICKRYYLRLYDTDDLHQEALIVCFKSLQSYNIDYQISFGAFYKLNLERHFCSLLRHEKSQKRLLNSSATSYEQYMEDTTGEISDKSTIYSYDIEGTFLSKIDFQNILSQLSSFEKDVLHMHLTTHRTVQEIADELNVKIDKVYCTFYRIRKKLKEQLLNH